MKEPTHIHHDGSISLIDLIFVSNSILSNSCHVAPPLSNADHKGIHMHTSWRPTSKHNSDNHCKGRIVWRYNQANWELANDLINCFDWNSLLSDNINETWTNWSQKFLSIMNECIPKKKLPNRKNLPWLSKKLINLIKWRNLLYKRAKLTGNFTKYKAMRNRVASELRFAKQSYFQRLNPKNSKDFWRAMKYLNRQKSTIPIHSWMTMAQRPPAILKKQTC